jgi:hypothetical protein
MFATPLGVATIIHWARSSRPRGILVGGPVFTVAHVDVRRRLRRLRRRWDLAFAELYVNALDADRRGDAVPGPWRIAFDAAREQPDLPPLRHVLFGLNAHINFDRPQALLAVISPAGFDNPSVLRSRRANHGHVDAVLRARVGAEDDELNAVSTNSLIDRLLRPANRARRADSSPRFGQRYGATRSTGMVNQ